MSTRLDDVIVALYQKWKALDSTSLTGVNVVDGPQVSMDPTQNWLVVGHTGGVPIEGEETAIGQQDLATFTRGKHEALTVDCGIVAVSGDPAIGPCRRKALQILDVCETSLRQDMTLGDLVMNAYIQQIMYVPTVTSTGAKIRITFTVSYEAMF